MSDWFGNASARANDFAQAQKLALPARLGAGYDGVVYQTSRPSAIKSFRYREGYESELAVYMRLTELQISEVEGCRIPALLTHDNATLVIEMEIVSPPFILDFAGASLDDPRDFPAEVADVWLLEKQQQFGEEWPRVQRILTRFAHHRIYLSDVKPGNITFH